VLSSFQRRSLSRDLLEVEVPLGLLVTESHALISIYLSCMSFPVGLCLFADGLPFLLCTIFVPDRKSGKN
jgi:hypothetical protein